MKTPKRLPTREEKIEVARATISEVPTTTRVKAWTFCAGKKYYVIIAYFLSLDGYRVSVFPGNRKGAKTSDKSVIDISNTQDYMLGFQHAIEVLIPVEPEEEY